MSNQGTVQTQFGTEQALEGYATSQVHAQGESLDILTALIKPQADWQALDVATGAGIRHLPEALKPLFAPRWAEDTMYFSLWEIVIIARKVK